MREKADLAVALACLAILLGAMVFSEMDNDFATTMRIHAAVRGARSTAGNPAAGGRTILVVERDDGQRLIAKTALERYGYSVMLADNTEQAAGLLRQAADRVALVILEGKELADLGAEAIRQLQTARPGMPVLVCQPPGEKAAAGATASIESPMSAVPLVNAVNKALASQT